MKFNNEFSTIQAFFGSCCWCSWPIEGSSVACMSLCFSPRKKQFSLYLIIIFLFNRNQDDMQISDQVYRLNELSPSKQLRVFEVFVVMIQTIFNSPASAKRPSSGWVTAPLPCTEKRGSWCRRRLKSELLGPPVPPGWFIWGSLNPQDFYISHFVRCLHFMWAFNLTALIEA